MKFHTTLLKTADVREAAGVAGGDEIDVELELDTAPRELAVPPELREALDQQRFTIPIEKAKTPETRARNVEKAIRELGG